MSSAIGTIINTQQLDNIAIFWSDGDMAMISGEKLWAAMVQILDYGNGINEYLTKKGFMKDTMDKVFNRTSELFVKNPEIDMKIPSAILKMIDTSSPDGMNESVYARINSYNDITAIKLTKGRKSVMMSFVYDTKLHNNPAQTTFINISNQTVDLEWRN